MITLKKQHKRYFEYKDSGIEWIGEIPSEWKVQKAKYFMKSHTGGVWGDDPQEDNNDLPCVRVADFDYEKLSIKNAETVRNIQLSQQKNKILSLGSILVEKSGGGEKTPVGRAVMFDMPIKSVCANFIEKVELNSDNDPKFFTYVLATAYAGGLNLASIKQNTGIQNLDLGNYFSENFIQPSKETQKYISSYLDEKTALLDSIIEKKKRQIELLKEKRTALINKAVTRGLDDNAEMKDSGVEWIGEIPRGWEVRKLKYCSKKIITGTTPDTKNEDYFDGEENWFTPSDFSEFEMTDSSRKLSKGAFTNGRMKVIPQESVLVICIGATLGKVGICSKASAANQQINAVIPKKGFSYKFIGYYLLSMTELVKSYSLVTTMAILNQDRMGRMEVITPSFTEQEKIVGFLDFETQKIDQTVMLVEKSINFLKEYKTSLISNVVTGKVKIIDHFNS